MSLREIPREEWAIFLDQFSRDHHGWIATIERAERSSHRDIIERRIVAVAPEIHGRQISGVAIEFQDDAGAGASWRVEPPTRLRADENKDGLVQSLDIDGPDGTRTRIRFRTVAPPEALDGIAPGEL